MAATDNRIPANRVGLVVVVLLASWLAFSFYPRKETRAPALAPVATESKLRAVGLEDNPDWEGMPEFFAVWADHAKWENEKTQFAYWNPGSDSYSYYFEATRENGRIRFQAISKAKMLEGKEFAFVDDEDPGAYFQSTLDHSLAETEAIDFRSDSSTHPFVFFHSIELPKVKREVVLPRTLYDSGPHPAEMKPEPIKLPEFTVTPPPITDDRTKK